MVGDGSALGVGVSDGLGVGVPVGLGVGVPVGVGDGVTDGLGDGVADVALLTGAPPADITEVVWWPGIEPRTRTRMSAPTSAGPSR